MSEQFINTTYASSTALPLCAYELIFYYCQNAGVLKMGSRKDPECFPAEFLTSPLWSCPFQGGFLFLTSPRASLPVDECTPEPRGTPVSTCVDPPSPPTAEQHRPPGTQASVSGRSRNGRHFHPVSGGQRSRRPLVAGQHGE